MKRGIRILVGLIIILLVVAVAIYSFKNNDIPNQDDIDTGDENDLDLSSDFDSQGKQELLDKLVEICKTSKVEIENANTCIESEANKLSLNAECESLKDTWDYSNNEEKQETLDYFSEFCITTNSVIELANACASGNIETYDCE